MRILILGGTSEARRLAECLGDRPRLAVTLSLAGRTATPLVHKVPVRIGGFGGAQGLTDYLRGQRIEALIDATHPYAAVISDHAAQAAEAAGVPLLALRRPPWRAVAGDRWIEVANLKAAADALEASSRRVFLALGRSELAAFVGAPQHHYLVRSVDPVAAPLMLRHATYITGRGPFAEADELALLRTHRIEVVIAKNSGGAAVYGKIAAARHLGLAVIMVRRPVLPDVAAVETVADAVAWLDHVGTPAADRGV